MKIKVCGMKHAQNIQELSTLDIDFMGMIFYPKSPRYVDVLDVEKLNANLKDGIKRVGVFVNADLDFVLAKVNEYAIDIVQLHGTESPDFCRDLQQTIPVIKAFSIAEVIDLEQVKNYDAVCDYFLFDTKTPQYGGSGKKFDWSILTHYQGSKPFILSGGISDADVEDIKKINHPTLWGIDLNSKFEIEPGLKNIKQLEKFINEIQ